MEPDVKSIQVFAGSVAAYIKFDINKKLRDLRTVLLAAGHIHVDDDTQAWRFVSPTVEKPGGDLSEAIIGLDGSELYITVKDFLHGVNKVRLTNIRRKRPDLIGVSVDYLSDRDMEVRISLNSDITPDHFQPVMMANVRPSNKDDDRANFDNVVLCEKKTAIGFVVTSKKHKGFVFSIKPREGDSIVEWACATSSTVGLSMYENTGNAILVDSFSNLNIPTQQSIGHRRITVKAWKLASYTRDGKSFNLNDGTRSMFVANKSGVDVVSGDSIEGGAFGEGNQTNGKMGIIGDVVADENDVFGEVNIDFFVFKTKEDAQHMIDSRVEPIYAR